MSTYPTTTNRTADRSHFLRRRPAARRGSVALVAIVTMIVVFILALGLLTLGGNVRLNGRRQLARGGALTVANAGVEYGYWQVRYKGASLPQTYGYNKTTNGSTLNFTVTATDNSANVAGTVKFVSAGTQGRETCTVTKVLTVPSAKTVFDYALCSASALTPSRPIVTGSGGANGDTRVNGNISLPASSVINGNALAAGTIGGGSVTGSQAPGSAALSFPALDPTAYQGVADRTYSGSQTWNGFTFLRTGEVVYVQGNVTLRAGNIFGTGTLVVSGTLTIQGNLSYTFSSDKMAVLSAGGLSVPAVGVSAVGFYYIHNSSGSALATFPGGNFTLAGGSLAADATSTPGAGPYTFIHDPSMNAALGKQLHLPGY